jgi:hypothetical protein
MTMRPSILAATLAVALLPAARASAQEPAPAVAPSAPAPAEAQPPPERLDHSKEDLSLGFDLRRFQDDFGLGGTVSTPMLGRWVRFTLGGGVAWYPHSLDSSGNQTWDTFGHGRLVVEVGPTFQEGLPVRPYGFGGVSALYLPPSLSSQQIAVGGVGGFGMELAFMHGPLSGPVTYYMEIGGCGYDAVASKVPTSPDIASGLLIGAGFRAYL